MTDRTAFQLAQLAFWLMAAPDGHAKNFSIFLRQGNAYEMTPLYDVLSAWPYVGRGRGPWHWREVRRAMTLRSKDTHCEIRTIRSRHGYGFALKSGGLQAWEAVQGLVDSVAPALDTVETQLPQDFISASGSQSRKECGAKRRSSSQRRSPRS